MREKWSKNIIKDKNEAKWWQIKKKGKKKYKLNNERLLKNIV